MLGGRHSHHRSTPELRRHGPVLAFARQPERIAYFQSTRRLTPLVPLFIDSGFLCDIRFRPATLLNLACSVALGFVHFNLGFRRGGAAILKRGTERTQQKLGGGESKSVTGPSSRFPLSRPCLFLRNQASGSVPATNQVSSARGEFDATGDLCDSPLLLSFRPFIESLESVHRASNDPWFPPPPRQPMIPASQR